MKIKGFTLVELLIASSIFSVIALSLYSALQAGIFSYKRMDSSFAVYQAARVILDRMEADLANSFIYSGDNSNFRGTPQDLDFFTTADSFENGSRRASAIRIKYGLNNGSLNRTSYQAAESLLTDIKRFSFVYASAVDNSNLPYAWQDYWPNTADPKQLKSLPKAVKIKLVLIEKMGGKEIGTVELSRLIPIYTGH